MPDGVTVAVQIQPAPELRQTEPDVCGIYLSRSDNTLQVGAGHIQIQGTEGGESTVTFDGPVLEVEVTGDTDIYHDLTELPAPGKESASYIAPTDIVPINQMHQWTLHVETVDGQPVDDATISVSGGMPEHGHGLPTWPQVIQNLGNGDYLVEGLEFQMGGWWVVDFVITANGQSDTVHFNMTLK